MNTWFKNNIVAIALAFVSVTVSVSGVYVKFTLDINNLQRDIIELVEDIEHLEKQVEQNTGNSFEDFKRINEIEGIVMNHFHE